MNPAAASFPFSVPPLAPLPWDKFKASVLELYKPPLRAKKTFLGMEFAIRLMGDLRWDEPCEDAPGGSETRQRGIESTADLTPAFIGRLVASRPQNLSPNSVLGNLRYVAALCSLAEKTGAVMPSPFRIRPVTSWVRPAKPKKRKHATREEIHVVLEYMRVQAEENGWRGWKAKRLYALTALFAYTGLRALEGIFLQIEDIDLDKAIIHLVPRAERRLKTAGSEAVVPIPPCLIPILREWLDHRMSAPPGFKLKDPSCPWLFPTLRRHGHAPWNGGGPGQRPAARMKIVAAQAVPGLSLTPLTLRHSLATHMLHFGAGKGMIQRILRHSNHNTQAWYTHDDDQNLRDAVRNVDF